MNESAIEFLNGNLTLCGRYRYSLYLPLPFQYQISVYNLAYLMLVCDLNMIMLSHIACQCFTFLWH